MPEVTEAVLDAAPPLKLAGSLGEMVDQLYMLNEEKRILDEALSEMDKKRKFVETAIMDKMAEQRLERSGGSMATASITTSLVPQVTDWDDFCRYMSRMKYWHLVEKRPSSTGCRELFESKGKIPGLVPFNKVKLSIRKVS